MQNISRSSSSSTSSPSKAIFAQDGHRPSNHCIKTPTRPQAQLKTATPERSLLWQWRVDDRMLGGHRAAEEWLRWMLRHVSGRREMLGK